MIFSFFIILAACGAYGLLHSFLASLAAKRLAQRWWPGSGQRYYRLFFNLQSVLTFLPLLYLLARLPNAALYAIPMPWLILTLALQVAGLVVLLAGVLQTGALAFLGIDVLLPGWQPRPSTLVTGGLYRWVRHPLYSGGLLLLWLAPGMSWNSLALSLGLSGYIALGIIFEECKLLREFGPAYAAYQRRTPVLFPFKKPERSE